MVCTYLPKDFAHNIVTRSKICNRNMGTNLGILEIQELGATS